MFIDLLEFLHDAFVMNDLLIELTASCLTFYLISGIQIQVQLYVGSLLI